MSIIKRLLCIDNINTSLTVGKWYYVKMEDSYFYYIENEFYYDKKCNNFITEKEYRKLKLKQLNNVLYNAIRNKDR